MTEHVLANLLSRKCSVWGNKSTLQIAWTAVSLTEPAWPSDGIKTVECIKWKHFPRYWPFVRGIHRSPVNSPHKGQWRRALVFSLICAWINGWVNNREAGDFRRHRDHFDVIVMEKSSLYIPRLRVIVHKTSVFPKFDDSRFFRFPPTLLAIIQLGWYISI